MLTKIETFPSLPQSRSNSYDILSHISSLPQGSFAPGDVLLLDLDETLLFCKGTILPSLVHPKLPVLLKTLQNQGVICVGLTARFAAYAEATQQQLSQLGLSFSLAQKLLANSTFKDADFHYQEGVFYSPSRSKGGQASSTKGNTACSLLQALKNIEHHTLEEHGLNKQMFARRIFFLDDLAINLEDVEKSVSLLKDKFDIHSITTHMVCSKPLFVSNQQDPTVFPEDLSTLKFMKHMDLNFGDVYKLQDTQGNEYLFKANEDLNHLQEELISDALYQAAGCAVPDFAILSEIPACLEKFSLPRNGIYRLAKFISPNKEQNLPLMQKKLANHFLIDALLANWDIAVGNFSSVVLDEQNTLYRINNSSALRYAAHGLKQQTPNWSAHHVEELITLLTPK